MDLDTLILETRERLGELEADFFGVAEVLRAVNEAQKRFCAEEPWPWLTTEWATTTEADEDELELPENVSPARMFILSVSGASLARGYPLERLEPSAGFRMRYGRTDFTGAPQAYYMSRAENDSGNMTYVARLIPTPDSEYDVEALYIQSPTDMTSGSEEPVVPEEYQEAIPARAAAKLFLKEQQISQKASEQFQLYYEVLAQAREDAQNLHPDETVAWGREMPFSRFRGQHDYVMGRVPPTGLGT